MLYRRIVGSHLGILFACVATAASFFSGAAQAREAEAADCHVGSYRLEDGRIIDVAPIDGDRLRWRLFDGTVGELRKNSAGTWDSHFGWTGRPDGVAVSFSECAEGKIRFSGLPGRRLSFEVSDTDFIVRDGVTLKGRLVLPAGNDRVPIVVLVHGAERDSALRNYFLQRMFPAAGIGAFVYDKRGTGSSTGSYSQDFDLLAEDAISAMDTARRLAGARAGRVGYQGGSQGGWIAPLAANRAPADFVIVSFGLAVSILDEDLQQMEMELVDKGYSPEIVAKAQEIAHAAGKIFASNFSDGFREFDAVRAKYRSESWYKDVHGHITWLLLPHQEEQIRALAKDYSWGTPFRYDPMQTLRENETPQLWVLGGRDYEAPSKETGRRIRTLINEGRPYTLAVYPMAEHGLTLFETAQDGSRISTRYVEGYFAMMRDFIKTGAITGPYGDAQITQGMSRR